MPQSLPATRSTAAAGAAEAAAGAAEAAAGAAKAAAGAAEAAAGAADYARSDYLIIFARSAGSFGRRELLNTNKRMSTISAAAFADSRPE